MLAAAIALCALAQAPAVPNAPETPKPTQSAPVLTRFVEAKFPEEGARLGLQATVHLMLFVGKDGSVTRALVETPQGHGFDEAAVEAAKAFTFSPGMQGGEPVDAVVELDYKFTLTAPDGGVAPAVPVDAGVPAPTGRSALVGRCREHALRCLRSTLRRSRMWTGASNYASCRPAAGSSP